MSFVAAWMDLEIIILSDINQTNTIAYHLYVESKKKMIKDFPGDPVVKIPYFHYRGLGFDPWSWN